MAELVPLKSFASAKGSNSGLAKPGAASQPAIVARFAAIDYVRKLTVAPDGSRISSTEKNVAVHLALAFNSDLGIAWPGVATLSNDACISERHCRRSLASLERKRVIQRVYMRRDGEGGQTSNEYFFPALGSPPQTPEAKARRLEMQKISRTPMPPMTARRRQTRPIGADPFVQSARTNATGEPGHRRPPIESLGDCSIDSQSDSTAEAQATRSPAKSLQPAKSRKAVSKREKAQLADLGLARIAWNSAIEKARAAFGATEFKKYRFRDVTVVSADEYDAGTVHLTLSSPAREKAEAGIAKHDVTLSNALCGFYGCAVKLRVIDHERARTPHQSAKTNELGKTCVGG